MQTKAPLPGGPRPLPYQVQARGCAWATAVLAVAAVAALPFGPAGLGVAIVSGSLAFTAGLLGVVVALMSRSWRQQLRRMEAGAYHVHWRYDAAEWAPFRERFAKETRRINWILPLILSVSGLLFAVLLYADDNLIGGSVALTLLVPVAVALAAGWLIARALGWLNQTSLRLMDHEPPEAIIGSEGLFITGQYWPWQTFGQHLMHVSRGADGAPTLDFHFEVAARYGTTTKVVAVPVPAGAGREADHVLGRLSAAGFSVNRSQD